MKQFRLKCVIKVQLALRSVRTLWMSPQPRAEGRLLLQASATEHRIRLRHLNGKPWGTSDGRRDARHRSGKQHGRF